MVEEVVFEPNGAGDLRVAAADGSPCHEIDINEATSRVKVFANVC